VSYFASKKRMDIFVKYIHYYMYTILYILKTYLSMTFVLKMNNNFAFKFKLLGVLTIF